MENKLDIRKDVAGKEQRLFLEGRLDASWAGHLDDYLNNLVREGSHRIILNMSEVHYLSSAGIRILVNQYKKTQFIGGLFVLEAMSAQVSEVLEMVGMKGMLTLGDKKEENPEQAESQHMFIKQFQFDNEVLSDEWMTIHLEGDPTLTQSSRYTAADNRQIKFSANHYGLGIGAIGDGFDDCSSRYGEFLAIGEALVYKPSDGAKVPDFALKTGRFEPEIHALYSLQAKGLFSNRLSFNPIVADNSIDMEDLVEGLAQISGQQQFVFLMIAEIDGMVGVSLAASPVNGKRLFEFPGVREFVNFTTEPAYAKMLSVTLGFFARNPDSTLKQYLRPIASGSTNYIHAHSAVFPYQALPQQERIANKLVMQLFENNIPIDVLHLMNDSREVVGLGDSTFKHGIAWLGKLNNSKTTGL